MLGNPVRRYQLPQRDWVALNRLHTGHGRCEELVYKWNMADLPDYDCGHPSQTIHHILKNCPILEFNGSMLQRYDTMDEAILCKGSKSSRH